MCLGTGFAFNAACGNNHPTSLSVDSKAGLLTKSWSPSALWPHCSDLQSTGSFRLVRFFRLTHHWLDTSSCFSLTQSVWLSRLTRIVVPYVLHWYCLGTGFAFNNLVVVVGIGVVIGRCYWLLILGIWSMLLGVVIGLDVWWWLLMGFGGRFAWK